MEKDTVSKTWFLVFPNPGNHGYSGEPKDVIDKLISDWVSVSPTRSCAAAYCISADGLHHVHMVVEDVKAMRFSTIKKAFPSAHIEPTKGSKNQAEDYINKRGQWKEKGEQVLFTDSYGEIKGHQGKRFDMEVISDLIEQGYSPQQIYDMNLRFYQFKDMIESAYIRKKSKGTPFNRDVKAVYHVGEPGSGKSYAASLLMEQYGEDNVYFVSQYDSGYMDGYLSQPILFLDEFKCQIPFSVLLQLTDKYKGRIHARYNDKVALWNEVHITSVFPPERLYDEMVQRNKDIDTREQLFRRIHAIVYHWKDGNQYHSYSLPMSDYKDYEDLKARARGVNGFVPCDSSVFNQ